MYPVPGLIWMNSVGNGRNLKSLCHEAIAATPPGQAAIGRCQKVLQQWTLGTLGITIQT